jgi:hypothetical protein
METSGRISPEQLRDFLEALPGLLEALRAEGYGTGTRQHVAVHELIGSLVARGLLPDTLRELSPWLAPLLCFTPAQQEEFGERYLSWLERRPFGGGRVTPVRPAGPEPHPEPEQLPKKKKKLEKVKALLRAHRPLVVAGAAALCAAAIFLSYLLYKDSRQGPDPARLVVIEPPVTDPLPTPLNVPSTYPPLTTAVTSRTPEVTSGQAWDVDKVTDERPEPADLSKVTGYPPPAPPPGFWTRNYPALLAVTFFAPFAGFGLWRARRRLWRRKEAERRKDERPRYDKLRVRGARERVFQSAALRPVARGLRRYRSVESRLLDTRRTVLASVGRGGLFTPVYGRRRALPEYLVLIDRVGYGDQLAQFNSDIVARLAENDVYLDTYYFHGDPRRCHEAGADSAQLSLSDLAARHPEHFLVIFGDGTGFISTTTGQPEPFVEQFLLWRGRAMLTPIPRLEWDYREWALGAAGLQILPASLDGLRALVEAASPDAQPARAPGFDETPPYPCILLEQPALWKEREPPAPHQTRRLLKHLRGYLGAGGYELLCACAVYPLMQWGVTLFLAYELLGRREVDEVLPRLLRLPWFRNGTMPAWLRKTLVGELPRRRRRLVRERLEHLLLAFLEEPERGLQPRFGEAGGVREAAVRASVFVRLRERLAAWRRRRRLRLRLETTHARSPLAEPVFVNFITGNRRAEALPESLRHKLFRRGVSAFGLRLAPALALVSTTVLTALFLLLLARPVDNIDTAGAPDDLISRLLAPTPDAGHTTDPDFSYTPTSGRPGQSYDLEVSAVSYGAYDLTRMRLLPTGGAASSLTLKPLSADAGRLRKRVTIAPDAPLGPTELRLYDGERLRASFPFTIVAAASTPTPTPVPFYTCPDVAIARNNNSPASDRIGLTATLNGKPVPSVFPIYWSAAGQARIMSGQGTPYVVVSLDNSLAVESSISVTIERTRNVCPNVATYSFGVPKLGVSVEPQTVTICPSNPKLDEPPDSTVSITVRTTMMIDITVSDGKISSRGVSRANYPVFDWNLSGLSPGTYTVTASLAAAAAQAGTPRQGVSQTVTVNGCPAVAATPQDSGAGQLRISFDDDGKQVNLYGVNMTVRLVPRGKPPRGFAPSTFVRVFKSSASESPVYELIFDGVPYGDYKLLVSSSDYEDATFPLKVGQPAAVYSGLRLKMR